MNNSQEGGST